MNLWMDPKKCRGCLRCELACSFHKSGHKFFNPTLSSTRVTRNNENKLVTMILDARATASRVINIPLNETLLGLFCCRMPRSNLFNEGMS